MLNRSVAGVSRRRFLSTAAGAGGALLVGPSWLRAAAEVDPRVAQIVASTLAVDMHNHVYPGATEPHPHGAPDGAAVPTLGIAQALKASGLTAACAAFVLDFTAIAKPGDADANFLQWLTALDAELHTEHVPRALHLKDLQAAHEHGHPAIVQSTEGAQFLEGKLERLHEVYKRGLRHLQLLHVKDDLVAPLGDVNTVPAHLGGLTAFGASVIRECEKLGVVVDLAHASHETVLGAVKVMQKPFLVSHTSLEGRKTSNAKMAEMMRPHLITRDHAKVVAEAGGVIGVWTKLADSLPEFVESVRAMVDVVGVEHVGIGTDTDLLSARAGQGTSKAYADMPGGFFPAVVAEMLKQGFSPEDIDKVGGANFCRVFGMVTMSHHIL